MVYYVIMYVLHMCTKITFFVWPRCESYMYCAYADTVVWPGGGRRVGVDGGCLPPPPPPPDDLYSNQYYLCDLL